MKETGILGRLGLMSSVGLLVGAILFFFAYDFGRKERAEILLHSARTYSNMISAFRHFYSQEIVSRLKEQNADIAFSHDYRNLPDTLPLPATLTIELSSFLARQPDHPSFEMISRHPFTHRPQRELSGFSERAMTLLESGAKREHHEITQLENGQTRFDYAHEIRMEAECVACHNSHPQSSRRDWKVGDIRGIQQVVITTQEGTWQVFKRMSPFLAAYLLALGAALALAYRYSLRNRKVVEQLRDNARRSHQKSKALQEATARLFEVEGYLSDAIASLPDGFVLYDRNDRLVLCNEKYREIYATSADLIQPGMSFEEIIRAGVERGQYPEALKDPERWIERRMEFHYHPSNPIEQKLDDGRWLRVFEQQTERGQIVGFRVDITELKEREQALADQESQLRATMESALDGIIVINEEGIIQEFNDAASKIFGFTQDEALGEYMADLIVPLALREAHEKGMAHYRKTGEGPVLGQRITVPGLCKDGREITLELAINPATGTKGQLFIAYMRDITDSLAQQKALEEAKEAAEQATKAKSAFLATMSHEIRTPLNGLLGLLEMLEAEAGDPDMHDHARSALDAAEALAELLNSILDYSRLEEGKIAIRASDIALAPYLKKTMDLMRPIIEKKGLEASLDIDPSLPAAIRLDPIRLRQMLLNLLGNAAKFTTEGTITLQAELSRTGKDIRFHIEDTGIGINEADFGKLFDRFETLDSAYNRNVDGSGLGLSITKTLADLMGGKIEVNSKEGVGSIFTITLPLIAGEGEAEPAPQPHTRDLSNTETELVGKTVLLAEDNPTNRLVLTASLEEFGMQITPAEDGKQALELARSSLFDLVILDISMPVMDGLEAVQHIRKLPDYKNRPILAYTAYSQQDELETFLSKGFDTVLGKPSRKATILQTIDRLFRDRPDHEKPDRASISEDQALKIEAELVNLSILEPMFAGIPDDMRQKLADSCYSDVERHGNGILTSLKAPDWASLHRHAHSLKGVAATFGLDGLYEAANKIADLTRSSPDIDQQELTSIEADKIKNRLHPTLEALAAALSAYAKIGPDDRKKD